MKPPAPLQAHNTRNNSIFPTQRRWRFHLRLSLREQRRQQFHPTTKTGPQWCHRFQPRNVLHQIGKRCTG